jgi:hypothetical protein
MKLLSATFALLFVLYAGFAQAQVLNAPNPGTGNPGSQANINVTGTGTTFGPGVRVWLSLDPNSTAGAFEMTDVFVNSATDLDFRVACGVPFNTYFILVQGGGNWNGNPWPDPVTNGAQLTVQGPQFPACLAIAIDCQNTTYSQNFDSLLPTTNGVCPANPVDMNPGNVTFTNGVTIPGWHVAGSGIPRFYSGDGSCDLQSAYHFGNNGSPDRALGAIGGAVSTAQFGASFVNRGTAAITEVQISFVREHWRRATTPNDRTRCEYSTDAGLITGGTWTAVPQLDLVPNYAAPAGALNGNLPANRQNVNFTITGLNITPGQLFWLRWSDEDTPGGFDDGLALDDFQATFTYFGGAAVGTLTGANTVCTGNASGTLTLGGSGGTIVRWESAPTPAFSTPTPIANVTNTLSPGILPATTCYRVVVNTGACAEAFSNVVCATVDPCTNAQLLTINPPAVDLCNPQQVTVTGLATTFLASTNVFLSTDPVNLVGAIPTLNRTPISDTELRFDIDPSTPPGTYFVFVENGGTQTTPPSAYPASIALNVVGVSAVGGAVDPANLTVCSGANAGILTLLGSSGPVLYWEASPDNFATPGLIVTLTNTTTSELFNNLVAETWYRAALGDVNCPVYSAPARIEIDPSSIGGQVFADQVICGVSAGGSLLLLGTMGNVLRWEESTDNFVADIRPINNTQYEYTYSVTATTQYRAVLGSAFCTATSDFATVTVQLPPDPGIAGNDTLVCRGTNTVELRLRNYTGDVVRWEASTDDFTTDIRPIASTSDQLTLTDVSVPTKFRAVVAANGLCEEFSVPAVVDMDPLGVAGTVGPDVTVCGMSASGRLELSGLRGPVVRWERAFDRNFQFKENLFTTTRTYTYRNIMRPYCYRAVVQISPTCPETFTNPTCITLVRTTSGGLVGPNRNLCKGDPINHSLALINAGGPIVRWESSLDCEGFTNPTPIAVVVPRLDITQADTTTCYRAVIQDANCPTETYSSVARIGVSSLSFAPVVTKPEGCAKLGQVVPNGKGGITPVLMYTVDPPVVPPVYQNLIEGLPAGTYVISAFDGASRCTADTTVTVPVADETASIDLIRDITTTTATLDLSGPPNGPQPRYNLRYRIKGNPLWTNVFNIPFPSRELTGLQNNTEYEVEVQYVCPNGNLSDWADRKDFATLPEGDCATTPIARAGGIYVTLDSPYSATIYWNRVPGAAGYLVNVGLASASPLTWPTYITCDPTQTLTIKGLVPGRTYRTRVRTSCANCTTSSNQNVSPWSVIVQFTMPLAREQAPSFSSEAGRRLEVYPNPARERVSLRLEGSEQQANLELFDLAGRRQLATPVHFDAEGRAQVDLPTGLASGIYLSLIHI